jgi:biotin transport system substrate-specific component
MRTAKPLGAANVARTVVFAAFIAVLGLFPGLYLAGAAVPVVLQNMGPLLAASLLGARRGGAATLLFLVLVVLGFPLLSGGQGGLGAFAGPSGGFIVGWLVSAVLVGLIVRTRARPGVVVLLLANLAGVAADYVIGIPWWGAYIGDLKTAALQSLVFVPGDAVKLVVVAMVAVAVRRAVPTTVLDSPRASTPEN